MIENNRVPPELEWRQQGSDEDLRRREKKLLEMGSEEEGLEEFHRAVDKILSAE